MRGLSCGFCKWSLDKILAWDRNKPANDADHEPMCDPPIVGKRLDLWGVGLLATAAALACAPQAEARPGDLDPSYGTGGVATILQSDDPVDRFSVDAADFQPGGKVVATGYLHDHTGPCTACGSVDTFIVSRLNENGSLDSSFGEDGSIEGNFGISGKVEFTDATVDESGRILIAGTTFASTVVVRLDPDGGLDSDFADGGVFTLPVPPGRISLATQHLAQQSSGDIVVEWVSADSHLNDDRSINLLRLLPDGSQDLTFGSGGTSSSPNGDFSESIGSIEIDSENRIVIGEGTADLTARTTTTRVWRYLPDGAPDPGFGSGGLATIESGELEGGIPALKVAIDGADRIDVLDPRGRITRLLDDGSPDPTFGEGGPASLGGVPGRSFGLQPDGRLLVAAGGTLARYLADGAPDLDFGVGGVTQVYPSGGSLSDPVILVQSDGRPLLVGGSGWEEASIVARRYRIDSDPPDDADADGVLDPGDPCPGSYGPGDGCPHYTRTIRLHRKGKAGFAGKVASSELSCLGFSRIVLFRQTARGARRLGSVRLPGGFYDLATFSYAADRNIRDPVYAVTSQRFGATWGSCERAQSQPTRGLRRR